MVKKLRENRKKSFLFRRLSIRQKLPLLICILLLTLIIVFSILSYIGVKNASIQTGRERLQTVTQQLSLMLGQSAQTVTATTNATASGASFKNYIGSISKGTKPDTTALAALKKLRTDSTWVLIELLDANKKILLESGLPGITISVNPDSLIAAGMAPGTCKIGKLYLIRNFIYYPVIAAIAENNKIAGYLLKWKLQKATPKAIQQFSDLIGESTTLYVGNADGSMWTDLITAVPGPPIEFKNKIAFSEYSRPGKKRVMATLHPIANTPWLIVLEVSRQKILEAANRFIRWIIIVGLILTIAGILIAWLMSRSITQPLEKLTVATSAIAAGNYNGSVEINRRDELGKLARAFNAMASQVTAARQNLEKKVQERTEQLEKANKELEAFSYSVSHDLRAPLRAIDGYAAILKEDYAPALDPEANRIADKITNNAKMMGRLIDDLIAFSKMGSKEIMDKPVDMNKLVGTCLTELLPPEMKSKYQLHIKSLPRCHGDENLLKQVWLNLISNALKYSSGKPSPFIEIGWTITSQGPAYYVKDNGVGFDMQYKDKLFGVFQRLHSTKEFEGTGIGLALARRIIRKHNGDIWGESTAGQGAIFYITLPAVLIDVFENNHA